MNISSKNQYTSPLPTRIPIILKPGKLFLCVIKFPFLYTYVCICTLYCFYCLYKILWKSSLLTSKHFSVFDARAITILKYGLCTIMKLYSYRSTDEMTNIHHQRSHTCRVHGRQRLQRIPISWVPSNIHNIISVQCPKTRLSSYNYDSNQTGRKLYSSDSADEDLLIATAP